MAQAFYSIDLTNPVMPMLSEQQTRTVIGSTAGEAPAASKRVGLAYIHNVMPSRYGLDAIGYLQTVLACADLPAGVTFTATKVIFGNKRTRLHLAWDSAGQVYVLPSASTSWAKVTGGAGLSVDAVTEGTVNGVSYLYYSRTGCYVFDESTQSLVATELTGLLASEVIGLVASSGYLIAYTEEAIAWSSTLVPTDFVPSQVTGAGGGLVAGIDGDIVFCTINTLGVLVYTQANAIAGTYTGNARYPFKFREVASSKGGISLAQVAYKANAPSQFVYSKAGLQTITSQSAEAILPEVTDFLAGRRFEDYDEVTREFTIADLPPTSAMLKKLAYIASRYLVISYSLPDTGFTHALVYDTALEKAGKLKIAHTDVFEFVAEQTEVSKEAIAFLKTDGSVEVVDFSTTANTSGVVMLGKLQLSRSRLLTLLGVEVENIPEEFPLDVYALSALDGKNGRKVDGSLRNSADNIREYAFRATAKNHSLVFTGSFNLVTVQVRYRTASRR